MQKESPIAAVGLMLCAAALMAATTLMAKALGRGFYGDPLSPLMISAGRFVFAWLTLVPLVVIVRPALAGARWRLHGARTFCGWGGVTCLFAAAAVMPLSDATAIGFLNPLFAMVLAIPLLGEHVGKWRWGAAAVAVCGALFIIRPGAATFEPYALVALASACFTALEVIFIKMLSGGKTAAGEPALRILFINNSIGAVIALSVAAMVWVTPNPQQLGLLAALGMTMLCTQSCFIQAMKRADASFVIPVFYATLAFATLYDFAIYAELPSLLSTIGATLILAGAFVLAWREGLARSSS